MMNRFEVIMQHNPFDGERISPELLADLIDFVWDDFTIANYNFLVLSFRDTPAYMQMKIDEEAFFVVEVLREGRLYEIKLDERSTVKALFKGYLLEYDLDLSPFKEITHRIH